MKSHLFFSLLLFMAFSLPSANSQSGLEIHGNAGCRGLMPENSMPAFLKAVELGVTALEMDAVISMDGQIVLSQEPWMSPQICAHPDGRPVLKTEAKNFNLFRMKYSDIQMFDCGMRVHPEFPHQQKIKSVKPTLKMVVRSIERFAIDNKYNQPLYNIELKSSPAEYDDFTPAPPVFVELVVNEIRRLGIEDKTTLQSFDVNILHELNKIEERKFKIGYLVAKGKKPEKNLSKLKFKPDIYNPEYKLVTEMMVQEVHHLGIKMIPWTVNTKRDFERLVSWGVDGVITDYPDIIKRP